VGQVLHLADIPAALKQDANEPGMYYISGLFFACSPLSLRHLVATAINNTTLYNRKAL